VALGSVPCAPIAALDRRPCSSPRSQESRHRTVSRPRFPSYRASNGFKGVPACCCLSKAAVVLERDRSGLTAELGFGFHRCRQPLRRDQGVAAQQQFLHFVPIDLTLVQPQRSPALRCQVGGQLISGRLSLSQSLVVAGQHLACDRDNAIPVMVIKEVSEGLFPDEKLRVRSAVLAKHSKNFSLEDSLAIGVDREPRASKIVCP
jgi:hypothetical protein